MIYASYTYNHQDMLDVCAEVTIEEAKKAFIQKFIDTYQLYGCTPKYVEEHAYNYGGGKVLFLNVVQKEELDVEELAGNIIEDMRKRIAQEKEKEEKELYLKLKEKYEKNT